MIKQYITEAKVKRLVKKWLLMHGLQPINNNTGTFKKVYTPKSGAKDRVHRIICGLVGSGDILVCGRGGLWVEIECKATDGRQRPEQKDRQKYIDSLGGLYIVVRCAEDIEAWKDVILNLK